MENVLQYGDQSACANQELIDCIGKKTWLFLAYLTKLNQMHFDEIGFPFLFLQEASREMDKLKVEKEKFTKACRSLKASLEV